MAIGTGWANGAWVDAGWITAAWSQVVNTVQDRFNQGMLAAQHVRRAMRRGTGRGR